MSLFGRIEKEKAMSKHVGLYIYAGLAAAFALGSPVRVAADTLSSEGGGRLLLSQRRRISRALLTVHSLRAAPCSRAPCMSILRWA